MIKFLPIGKTSEEKERRQKDVRNEQGNITDGAENKNTIRDYYKQLFGNRLKIGEILINRKENLKWQEN